MGQGLVIFFAIGAIVSMIVIMRFLGAWMFRIDEILKNQRELINEFRKITNSERN